MDAMEVSRRRARIYRLDIPLVVPFTTATGTVGVRSVALVRLGSEAPYGWGEAAPYPGQDETIDDVMEAARNGGTTPTLAAALNMAAADLAARRSGAWLGESVGAVPGSVPIGLAVGLNDVYAHVGAAVERGVATFKLKIAPGNVDHVSEVRSRFPNVKIGVDANGSFDPETLDELESLRGLGVAYLEQPVSDLLSVSCQAVRELSGISVFADESVRSVQDARALLASPFIDGVVVKVGRLGWDGAVQVRDLARSSRKLWRSSGLLESDVGRSFSNVLAACDDQYLSDVAPASWFMDVSLMADSSRLEASQGCVTVGGVGVGAEPDPERLENYQISCLDYVWQND